jgi:hypothetical protein
MYADKWQNNWADYGGSDVYVVNLGGQYHDDVRLPLDLVCLKDGGS